MSCLVCWEAIDGVQVSGPVDDNAAFTQVDLLINRYGQGRVYVYDSVTAIWYLYTKGTRGRVNELEINADEVPKPFRLIVLLGD